MRSLLRLEEVALTAAGIYFLTQYNLGLPIWLWSILFFSPDLGMLGYTINPKVGAVTYNIFHHRGVALLVYMIGSFTGNEVACAIGILLFAHASFDRIFGYGLKYLSSFKQTHLGSLEKKMPATDRTFA